MDLYNVKMWVRRVLTRLNSGKPIEKKVIFNSFGGKQYSEDPRAISEKMHLMFPEYEIVWVIWPEYRKNNLIPNYVRVIDGRMDFVRELPTACAYVTTNPLESDIYKRKGQFFVQTWHGDRGFKRCLYEAWGYREGKKVEIYDNKLTDLCVAASDNGIDVYHKAFKYEGEILKIGMPRNDKLVKSDEKEIAEIRKRFGISEGTKVLTYAPTFQDNNKGKQIAGIDIYDTLQQLENKGEKWVCLIRSHSASKGIIINKQFDKTVDVSSYPDMADILLVSDMLITDFSSCAGDFLLRKKAVVLALFDEYGYAEISKDFRVNIEDTGFFIAHNQEELNRIIQNNFEEDFKLNCEKILSYYNIVETGTASEEICNRINQAYEKIR